MELDKESNNKRIVKNSFYLYLRTFFVLLINLYTSRLVLDILGIEDYGIYTVVAGFVIMFSFLNDAMSTSTQRFLSFEIAKNQKDKLKTTFQTSLVIHLSIALMILILGETIGLWFLENKLNYSIEKDYSVGILYQLSLATLAVSTFQVPFKASLIANESFKIFSLIHVSEVLLKLLAVYCLTFNDGNNLILYGLVIFIVTAIICIIYVYYTTKHFQEASLKLFYDTTISKSLLSFTSWSLFGNVAYVGTTQGINILLNLFFGPLINAALGVAMQVQSSVKSFAFNVQIAVNPQIIKTYAEGDIDYMKTLIYAGSKFSFYFLLLLTFPILIETKLILDLWLKEIPDNSIIFTRLILITVLIDSFSGTLMTAFQATGDIKKYQIIIGSILFLNVPISYVVLKLGYQPYFVMLVAIILSVGALIFRLLLLRKVLPIPTGEFFLKVVFKGCIIGGVAIVVVNAVVKGIQPPLLRLFCLLLVEIITIVGLIFMFGLTKGEKNILTRKIKSLKK